MKTVSTRMTNEEYDAVRSYCDFEDTNPNRLLNDLLRKVIDEPEGLMNGRKQKVDILKKKIKKTSEEEDMKPEELEAILKRSNQNFEETLKKTFGGNNLPGGKEMDAETKIYLDKLGGSVGEMNKMLKEISGDDQKEKTEAHFKGLIEAETQKLLQPYEQKIERIEKLVCNEDGTVCFYTQAELDNWKKEQVKKMEDDFKKKKEEKPDLKQVDQQMLYDELRTREGIMDDLKDIHIEKLLKDPEYRKKALDALCDTEECKVDVLSKAKTLMETKKEDEKEKKEEKTTKDKKFFLDKEE